MKSGLISAIWTARAYKELGIDPGRKLVFIFNGDEETGSHESSDIICGLARKRPGGPGLQSPVWETGILRQEEREI